MRHPHRRRLPPLHRRRDRQPGRRRTTAQDHYRHALHLSRISGATFIHNVAAVGLVSVQAAAGEVPTALNGYRELIDHWERTGGWIQQWTTLRNLADLLDLLEDRSAAAFLRGAADANDSANTNGPYSTDDATNGQIDAGGVASAPRTRTQALDVARQSISRHLDDERARLDVVPPERRPPAMENPGSHAA